jgi:hypothetical protein
MGVGIALKRARRLEQIAFRTPGAGLRDGIEQERRHEHAGGQRRSSHDGAIEPGPGPAAPRRGVVS